MRPNGTAWSEVPESLLVGAANRVKKTPVIGLGQIPAVSAWARTIGRTTVCVVLEDERGVIGCGTATRNPSDDLPYECVAPRSEFRIVPPKTTPMTILDLTVKLGCLSGPRCRADGRGLTDPEWKLLVEKRRAFKKEWQVKSNERGQRSALYRAVRDWLGIGEPKRRRTS